MTNKLAEYGHTFQVKSIACRMTDIGFMGQIYDILDESHFDNDALKWIVKQCKEYYNEYKKSITLDVFKVKTNEVHNDILKTTIVEKLKEIFRYQEAPDLDFIKDEYGIPPKNLLTYRILDGDKSDNIGGIKGAGLKTIIKYKFQTMFLKDKL